MPPCRPPQTLTLPFLLYPQPIAAAAAVAAAAAATVTPPARTGDGWFSSPGSVRAALAFVFALVFLLRSLSVEGGRVFNPLVPLYRFFGFFAAAHDEGPGPACGKKQVGGPAPPAGNFLPRLALRRLKPALLFEAGSGRARGLVCRLAPHPSVSFFLGATRGALAR